jgi:hypothetical protein
MFAARRRLVEYYEAHRDIGGSGAVKPARRRFGHVAADIREGMVDEGYPFRSL